MLSNSPTHSQLQKLNVEGNQLQGFPPGIMQLPLKQLNIEGNLMHMLLWTANARNQPQVSKIILLVPVQQHDVMIEAK